MNKAGPAAAAYAAFVAKELRSIRAEAAAADERARGPQGLRGAAGQKGDKGPQGLRGAAGQKGDKGPTGKAGSQGIRGAAGKQGLAGLEGRPGEKGWSPLLRPVPTGDRVVLEIHEWTGGEGLEPSVTGYLGPHGIVARARDATDVRGASGEKGTEGKSGTVFVGGGGGDGLTRGQVLALIEENGMQFDDYADAEFLPEQPGVGGVLVFSFSAPAQFIVIEMVSTLDESTQADAIDALEGRVATGATVPTATVGAILKHEQPVTLLVTTGTVRVLAPANTRINVYGKRRSAP